MCTYLIATGVKEASGRETARSQRSHQFHVQHAPKAVYFESADGLEARSAMQSSGSHWRTRSQTHRQE